MKQPMLSDYGLSDSDIEQIRSKIRQNISLKNSCGYSFLIVNYVIVVALLWSRFGLLGSFLVGFVVLCFLCCVWGVVYIFIEPLVDKYFNERELRIPGASLLEKYESKLAKYEEYKEKKRIEEEKRKAREELERKRRSWKYWTELSPFEFENEIAELYRRNGYDARVTPATNDGGIDIILSKGRTDILVQCKKHNSKVGPAPARELYGVMSSRGVRKGFLVCPAGFTSGAYDFAKKHNIRLIGLKRIMELATTNNSA